MDKFLIEFNNISNNKYDYLRLKSVSIFVIQLTR